MSFLGGRVWFRNISGGMIVFCLNKYMYICIINCIICIGKCLGRNILRKVWFGIVFHISDPKNE